MSKSHCQHFNCYSSECLGCTCTTDLRVSAEALCSCDIISSPTIYPSVYICTVSIKSLGVELAGHHAQPNDMYAAHTPEVAFAASGHMQTLTPYCSNLHWAQNSILHSERCLPAVCLAFVQAELALMYICCRSNSLPTFTHCCWTDSTLQSSCCSCRRLQPGTSSGRSATSTACITSEWPRRRTSSSMICRS